MERTWGHPVRGATEGFEAAGGGDELVEGFGGAEVGEFDNAGGGDEGVGPLDVAVDDAVMVEELEAAGELGAVVSEDTLGERTK